MKTMKTILATLLSLFIFTSLSATNADKKKRVTPDATSCLEISGRISTINKKASGTYTIHLYKENGSVDSLVFNNKSTFKMNLEKNSVYAIKISKEGYTPKLISISTSLPEAVEMSSAFRFYFETELLGNTDASELNTDALDFPIALVTYDEKRKCFDYHKKYTRHIKKQITEKAN